MSIPPKHIAAAKETQRLLESGNAKGAIQMGAQILREVPKFPEVHALLGRAYRQMGQTEQALARFRSAAELSPGDIRRWAEFVDELLKDGQKGRARKVAQKAPLKGPQKKQLMELAKSGHVASGPSTGGVAEAELKALQSMIRAGQLAEAETRAQTLLKTHADSAFLHNILGIVALSRSENRKAEERFRKTIDLSPKFAGAAANLGLALMRQRQFEAAIDVLRQAVGFEPGSVEARTNLANAYLDARWHQNALDEATEVLKLAPNDGDALRILAMAAVAVRDFDAALATFDRIEELEGISDWSLIYRFEALAEADLTEEAVAFAKAHINAAPTLITPMARLMAQLGDVEAGQDWLRRAVEATPDDTAAYFHYGMGQRWIDDDPMLGKLAATLERAGTSDVPRAELAYYAQAKACGDLKRPDEIFPALVKANEIHGAGLTYDFERQETLRKTVEAAWNAEALSDLRGVGVESVAPIFIVGMPRSGSTLIEHVIAAHPEVSSIGEDSFTFPFFPLSLQPERNTVSENARNGAKEVRRLAGPNGILLDKYLNNFQRLGILAAAFPKAKFVQTRRDPRAIALSIYSNPMKVLGHPYSTRLEDIARFYLHYLAFMDHWRSVLGDRIIVSDYQQLVEDPEPQIREMIERLDLPWDDACLKPEAVQKRVKTLSVTQVRSGIHAKSVERWKQHEKHLGPFTDILTKAGVL